MSLLPERGRVCGSQEADIKGNTDQEALDFQKIYADRQHHIHMSPLMEEVLDYCSGKAELGIITNGPSEHQWDKVKSLQAEKWIPHENIFVSADVGRRSRRERSLIMRSRRWSWRMRQSGL